ncbi:MAG: hypothetical protein WED10_00555 [Brumimicrobium sp.]
MLRYTIFIQFIIIVSSSLTILLCLGCTTNADNKTLASFEHNMPTKIAECLPLPESTTLTAQIEEEEKKKYSVMYRPNLTYPEMVSFVSENLSDYDWHIIDETIVEGEGERQSVWEIKRKNYTGKIIVSALGDENGTGVNGIMIITEE